MLQHCDLQHFMTVSNDMPDPVPLDRDEIARLAGAFDIEIHDLIDSTQRRARARVDAGERGAAVVIADAQSAGRGQRGRAWQSPPGAAIYLTVVWPSARRLAGLAGLSLVAGLAVRSTLARWQVETRLKWPNDIWVEQRKLGGILVEVLGDRRGSIVLIGIGLNLRLPDAAAAAIDQPWADLAQRLHSLPTRNALIGALLCELHRCLIQFEGSGLGVFMDAWRDADALAGRDIWLLEPQGRLRAHALGVDELGRLKVEISGRERLIASGEVSIRMEQGADGDHETAAGPRQ
jgi:BirA family biotin operon repressor/biotin-[acetyl-CoA-carboxylase] ligase